MSGTAHIIARQVIEVEANAEIDGLQLQQEVSRWNAALLPKLEQLFDRFAGSGQHIRMERLDISIDSVMHDGWTEQVLVKIIAELEKELLENIPSTPGRLHLEAGTGTEEAHVLEQLLFFLEHGYQAWWSPPEGGLRNEDLVVQALRTIAAQTGNSSWREAVQLVMANPVARRRMVSQFQPPVMLALTAIITRRDVLAVTAVWTKLKDQLSQEAAGQNRTSMPVHAVAGIFWEEVTLRRDLPAAEEILQAFLKEEARPRSRRKVTPPERKVMQKQPALKDKAESSLREKMPEGTRDKGQEEVTETSNRGSAPQQGEASDLKKEMDDVLQRPREPLSALQLQSLFKTPVMEEGEGIYVQNAGLVIMAPFLSTLFQHCRLMENGLITSVSKAVYLSEYLVRGIWDAKEYDLSLNKIMCGLDISEALDASEPLGEEEAAEVEQLLSVVIQYWTIIKNTSPEGLRESFLQRNGKLSRKGDDWLLQVEQKSYDMLLEHLPWTISLIRLSFMKTTLYVEWI